MIDWNENLFVKKPPDKHKTLRWEINYLCAVYYQKSGGSFNEMNFGKFQSTMIWEIAWNKWSVA